MNSCVLTGRLTADPELRTTPSGISVCRFTIAVDRPYQKAGEDRKADFLDVVAWRQNAEFVTKYFRKGSMIAVSGSLQTNKYEDKNGNKRTSYEIVADRTEFCGSKSDNSGSASSANTGSSFSNTSANDFEAVVDDDDLPF
jgi:single-strand DNA-binding protein